MREEVIDWPRLSGRYGFATRIPKRLAELASPVRSTRYDAWATVADVLVGEAAWFSASAPALGMLLDTVADAPEPDLPLLIAGEVLGGGRVRWLWGAERVDPPRDVSERALDHRDGLVQWLADSRAGAGAAMLLAMLVPADPTLRPVLEACIFSSAPAAVRASAVLGLCRAGAPAPPWLLALSGDAEQPPLVRGAAALARARLEATPLATLAGGLADWLAWEPEDDERLPWFDIVRTDRPPFGFDAGLPESPARAAWEVSRLRGPGGTDELVCVVNDLLPATDSPGVATQAARILIEAEGWRQYSAEQIVDPTELSSHEQEAMRALARCDLALPGGGYGLAPSGPCRRRWIGLEPPGPLERPHQTADGRTVPLWRAWWEWQNHSDEPMPEVTLSAHDRWEAWVQGSASYDFWVPSMELVEEELARVPHDDELFRRIARLCDELAARARAARHCREIWLLRGEAGALLLLPVVRAGRPIDPSWDDLVPVCIEPQGREILSAVPAPRREAILRRFAAARQDPGAMAAVASLRDLAPSERSGE